MREAEAAHARVDGWSQPPLGGALFLPGWMVEVPGAFLATLGQLTGEPRSIWKAVYGRARKGVVWLPDDDNSSSLLAEKGGGTALHSRGRRDTRGNGGY
jgi:hypothetical protein